MQLIVDGLEAEFEGQVAVVRLDADEVANVRLQSQFGVRGHPSFVVLNGSGHVSVQFFGPQTTEMLREAMVTVQNQ